MGNLSKIYLSLAIACTLAFVSWLVVRIVKDVSFDMNCLQYIERAANASSVEMAKEELSKAINYAEENGLTDGVSGLFIKKPKNDIGFWYKNMKTAYEELDNLPEDTTALEKTNVLMKLRESLTDGSYAVVPVSIEIYPNNLAYFLWAILSGVGAFIFWFAFDIRHSLYDNVYY